MTPKEPKGLKEQESGRPSPLGLEERITGALGGPVEGYSPDQIAERHDGRVHGIVGPWHGVSWRTARPIAPYHKGGHADPREAGAGNIVNCGAAMYMAPVGLVNAAVAAAATPGASPDSVVAACLSLAKDGTREAIEKVCETAVRYRDFESALWPLRAAVAPYDTVGPDHRAPSLAARHPSRLHAIEELPIALGMLVVSGGDHRNAVLGAVDYGRDGDSIATMAGALAGALGSPVPEDWAKSVAEADRLDLWAPARTLTEVAREVFRRDVRRRRVHERAFTALGGPACSD
ncbi:ADP-ribosylglycohydrolase family protein [Streptomyces sp. NPDC001393]